MATRWRQLHTRLHAPDVARQRALTRRRAQLTHDRQAAAEQLGRITRRLDDASSGLGRLRNRQLLAQLRDDHDVRTVGLDRLDEQLRQVDVELAALPSDHLTTTLGTPPADSHGADSRGADRWEQAAFAIERYRLRSNVTDPNRALGPEPDNPPQLDDRRWAASTLDQACRHLVRDPELPARNRALRLRR